MPNVSLSSTALWLKPISVAALIVDMASQEDLASPWLEAPEGKLCGREQAKAWALREVWRADGKGTYGMLPFFASKVRKTNNSEPQGDPRGTSALKET